MFDHKYELEAQMMADFCDQILEIEYQNLAFNKQQYEISNQLLQKQRQILLDAAKAHKLIKQSIADNLKQA